MEGDSGIDPPQDPSPSNIFAKYAYKGTPEKKTAIGKRKAVDGDNDGSASLSSNKQRGGDRKNTGSGGLSADTSGEQQGTKRKGLTNAGIISDQVKGSKKVKLYNHLNEIDDHLEKDLDIVFCGINPGEQSAQIGHHYGNPTNHFWSCLHASGLTSRKLDPREDHKLPKSFSIGLMNLVDRPSVEQSELSKAEQVAGVPKLLHKIRHFKPRLVCFVGLGIAEVVRANCGLPTRPKTPKVKAEIGVQSYKMVHTSLDETITETLFFAVSSTSGRVVRYTKTDKIQQFSDLRTLLEQIKRGEYDSSRLTPLPAPESPTGGTHSGTC